MARKKVVYSDKLKEKILGQVRLGLSQNAISKLPNMPSDRTMFNWKRTKQDFADGWFLAWQEAADWMEGECLEIADNTADDHEIKQDKQGNQYIAGNKEQVQRARLRIDTRMRLMEARKPSVYGRKAEINVNNIETMTEAQLEEKLRKKFKEVEKHRPKLIVDNKR